MIQREVVLQYILSIDFCISKKIECLLDIYFQISDNLKMSNNYYHSLKYKLPIRNFCPETDL